jgi:hypothetical protein
MAKKRKHPNRRIRWAQRLRPRWRVAGFLDRFDRYCWAELVDWTMQTDQRRKDITWYRSQGWGWWEARRDARKPLFKQPGGRRCQFEAADFTGVRTCYCGKFLNGERRPAASPVTAETNNAEEAK